MNPTADTTLRYRKKGELLRRVSLAPQWRPQPRATTGSAQFPAPSRDWNVSFRTELSEQNLTVVLGNRELERHVRVLVLNRWTNEWSEEPASFSTHIVLNSFAKKVDGLEERLNGVLLDRHSRGGAGELGNQTAAGSTTATGASSVGAEVHFELLRGLARARRHTAADYGQAIRLRRGEVRRGVDAALQGLTLDAQVARSTAGRAPLGGRQHHHSLGHR